MEKSLQKLEIPESFRQAPFYKDRQVIEAALISEEAVFQLPFLYDLCYHANPHTLSFWPWSKKENYFHEYWMKQRESIRELFHKREQKKAEFPMLLSVSVFIDQLFWSTGRPVDSLTDQRLLQGIQLLPFAPLNIEERLVYLLRQPDRFLSYIQLDELEQEFTKRHSAYQKRRQKKY
ncbi:hypothetical protein NIE88_08290 [Sporolactobacillus shoreicorticis]|uniref:YpoC family protein n=1 Tax=Sporolactobacillus shoreicorticis TaxID=1923877 RepID=A0ABW5S7Y2_9BACL|nr:hypothetical protein [Sporolactobacillus shoreicorticis]MCO7125768.1 hypothetical protein [Sporolactobacillus shoreicorticis]